ncbi:MAG: transposase [Planctomycetes bacterium]|nr:transposase [Planctomycetota bacterium]
MLLVGYSEGSPSQRRIDWRCADSPSLRKLLTIPLTESTLAHTSMTHIRERMPQSIHGALFEWVLRVAASKNLFLGNSVAVDSTTLEADAAIVLCKHIGRISP